MCCDIIRLVFPGTELQLNTESGRFTHPFCIKRQDAERRESCLGKAGSLHIEIPENRGGFSRVSPSTLHDLGADRILGTLPQYFKMFAIPGFLFCLQSQVITLQARRRCREHIPPFNYSSTKFSIEIFFNIFNRTF